MNAIGPVIVLTGATSGIGAAAARLFAREAGCLILHGRQPEEKARPWLDALRLTAAPGATLHYLSADFSELSQVTRLAADIHGLAKRVDVLINNAGRAGPSQRTSTVDGNEVTLQVNYLAPVLLTNHLLPLLGGEKRARIVNVASTISSAGASSVHFSGWPKMQHQACARSLLVLTGGFLAPIRTVLSAISQVRLIRNLSFEPVYVSAQPSGNKVEGANAVRYDSCGQGFRVFERSSTV